MIGVRRKASCKGAHFHYGFVRKGHGALLVIALTDVSADVDACASRDMRRRLYSLSIFENVAGQLDVARRAMPAPGGWLKSARL